ncbi:MAG: glycosyltransferase family 9 protein [Planctomycetes bacterium]|nr:glycosyltransferase family 9 protein [Planctomycetota bacterium]
MALSLARMHWIDRHIGRVLVTAMQPLNLRRYLVAPPSVQGLDPRRVLVVKFWGIGSIALAGQTLNALRAHFPRAEFHFLTLAANADFLRHVKAVDHVVALDICGGALTVLVRIVRLLAALRRRRYDMVVDLEFFTRFSALVSFLSGAPVRVGFHAWEVWRGNLHNIVVPFNRYWHVTRNFFNLGRAAGIAAAEPPPFRLEVGADARREAEAALLAAGVRPGERLVVFNPNAGGMALERRWPPENFAGLVRELAATDGIRAVLIGAPSERAYVARIAEQAGAEAVNLAGRLSIGGLIALLERAALLVSNDTGPLQLALTQERPTLSFFGPETPVLYGPRAGCHRVLYQELACSPCINVHSQKRVRCIFGHPVCLESIPVERAAAAARALLAGRGGEGWSVRGGP